MALILGSAPWAIRAQSLTQQPGLPTGGLPSIDGRKPEDGFAAPLILERQERSRNADRQRRLVADTDRLLALATSLKQQVGDKNKDGSSVDLVKWAGEIERLAKSVRDRMKG